MTARTAYLSGARLGWLQANALLAPPAALALLAMDHPVHALLWGCSAVAAWVALEVAA